MSNKEAIAALSAAQSQMKTPIKDATNPHFRNRYASLKACIKAIKPALNRNGFALIQAAGKDEFGHFIKTTFEHTSGGVFASKFYMEPEKKGMQALGSAATYAKRYGLLGLAGIEPDEEADDDANTADEEQEHDQAVREEREEVVLAGTKTPASEIPWEDPKPLVEETWEAWIERIKKEIGKATATWQIKKLGQTHNTKMQELRQHNSKWADELKAYVGVRWDQLNTGEK